MIGEEERSPGRKPRIAFAGSAGIGKTTLAQALSRRWQVPYVDEAMRGRIEAGLDLHTLSREAFRGLLLELADETHSGVETAIRQGGGVASDRSPLDSLAFWLHYGFVHDLPEATEAVARRQLERCRAFDLIVVLPWGVLPLQSDGVRSDNPWLQLQFHALVSGLLQQFLPAEQVARVPDAVRGLEARMNWLEARFSAMGLLPKEEM